MDTKPPRKIRLSRCELLPVAESEATEFLKAHHRAGPVAIKTKAKSVGIYLGDELLAVAQFCYPRTNAKRAKYSLELLRMAFKKDVRIYRGASALIGFYIERYDPSDFFTYQDTTGEATAVYEHAGMTLVSQAKKKQYLVAPGKTRETAGKRECYSMASVVMRGPDALLGTNLGEVYDENGKRKSNPRLFIEELGWHIEETSGDRVYEWFNPRHSHYVYKITAADSDKYYYGVRTLRDNGAATAEDCLKDPYFGSGGTNASNKFSNWKRKHRAKLRKEIVAITKNKSEAYALERELVGDLWKTDPLCLNSTQGGKAIGQKYQSDQKFPLATCDIHGETTHSAGGKCLRCRTKAIFSDGDCEIHGEVKFRKGKCEKCSGAKRRVERDCEVHGLTLHQGSSCCLCSASKVSYGVKLCAIHGETNFRGDSCTRCAAAKMVNQRACPKHGFTTHLGSNCGKCQGEKLLSTEKCQTHGLTIFVGGTCQKCQAQAMIHEDSCPIHGQTTFMGSSCASCRAEKAVSKRQCPEHGLVSFVGNKCRVCINRSTTNMRDCAIHGRTKHQGSTCSSCSSMRIAHNRYHGAKPNLKNCFICQEKAEDPYLEPNDPQS